MHKTVKELSNEIGVSLQAVHQAINKLLEKETLEKKGNAYILNPIQQAIIRDNFKIEKEKPSSISSSNPSSTLSNLVDTLKSELDMKNQRIQELQEQVKASSKPSSTLREYIDTLKDELDTKNNQIESITEQMTQLHHLLRMEKENNALSEPKEITDTDFNLTEDEPHQEKEKPKRWYDIFKRNK